MITGMLKYVYNMVSQETTLQLFVSSGEELLHCWLMA